MIVILERWIVEKKETRKRKLHVLHVRTIVLELRYLFGYY